jgi:flagellar protein FliO/FliZ
MDLDLILRFLLALLVVLGLIGLFAWGARRFGLSGRFGAVVGKSRRLRIVEVTPLDPKTRLVLLRRDDVEHLVLLGPAGSLVVESGIKAGGDFAETMAAAAAADVPASLPAESAR